MSYVEMISALNYASAQLDLQTPTPESTQAQACMARVVSGLRHRLSQLYSRQCGACGKQKCMVCGIAQCSECTAGFKQGDCGCKKVIA